MNIPLDSAWMIILAIVGFVIGTLWGHHSAIQKRVTYDECAKSRKDCPCTQEVQQFKQSLERLSSTVSDMQTIIKRIDTIVQ